MIDKIIITAEDPSSPNAAWRDHASVGRTAGAALDALTAQMRPSESATVIVLQNLRPDPYFTASQQRRLQELLDRRKEAEKAGNTMSVGEQSELEALVAEELNGTPRRAAAIANEMGL